MPERYRLAIVGAGPAGMAAAIGAAECGIHTILLDEQRRPGGQIYRSVTQPIGDAGQILGKDYLTGNDLAKRLQAGIDEGVIDYQAGASVWNLESDRTLSVVLAGRSTIIEAEHVLLCCGAQERPLPIPGWQLPGVMTAGAGQILLKTAGLKPANGVVLAGSGPLLGLLASQYIAAGVAISAIVDTTPAKNRVRSVPRLPGALLAPTYLWKGACFYYAIRKAGINVFRDVTALSAEGVDSLQQVRFTSRGREQIVEAEHLLLHNGVIPQPQLAEVAGCELNWNKAQHCWQVQTDDQGRTSRPGIWIAGDGGTIGGAIVAEMEGRRVVGHIASSLGIQGVIQESPGQRGAALAQRSLRRFLDVLFAPGSQTRFLTDETLVCRCEEIAVDTIRQIARRGCQGPNQAKSFSRAGMGPCQGRQCSLTVAALIAEAQGVDPGTIDRLRARPPVRPITLGEMGE